MKKQDMLKREQQLRANLLKRKEQSLCRAQQTQPNNTNPNPKDEINKTEIKPCSPPRTTKP